MADAYEPRYRIEPYGYGVEPQMSYICRGGVELWLPLNRDGYWLEPEAYSEAAITKRVEMSEPEARRAITCAQRINGVQLLHPLKTDRRRSREMASEMTGMIERAAKETALVEAVARAIYAVELARDENANSLLIKIRGGPGPHDAEYRIEAYEENPESWREYARAAIAALRAQCSQGGSVD